MSQDVFAAYKKARTLDSIGLPVVFIGTFESISKEAFQNVHGQEWSVVFRVKKVFFDSWKRETFDFNISVPENEGFRVAEEWYVIALHTRHGFYVYQKLPIPQK